MKQVQLNEFGLAESLESALAQINALASVAQHTISSAGGSAYLNEAAQLLLTIKNLSADAERYRAEWEDLIPRIRR
ncbi:hypothetical protein ASB68_23195 [Salmonella enterica]|uniref:Uncharacterized protein n=2 Tax=Salmonella enterica TaxID=28901 RepID=A0A5I0Y6Y9_SALET|nr:hypothetical protein [Salmonella enterica subsp. diarizonae]EAA9032545.1 hypothetical protein [Salmonella enterica subsp. enterica serovar Newport]EBH6833881.1 hypothetical protein [Salmonella enterica]EBS3855736.1 hypothetical protein [Salmonella enterica subsp. enterica serovar Javiana]ECB6525921.1 hypothetical protein [Salmonella enterica subsp. enterica serovar Potsdam]ECF0194528.1 hypothetical protein [Salmonella enterica subsp. enterica serovar London]ECH0692934.1 hypothetical protei